MRMRDVRRPSPSNEQVARGGAFRPHSSPRAREKQARTASGLINAPSISRGGAKIRVCRAQDPRTAAAPPLIGVMCNQLTAFITVCRAVVAVVVGIGGIVRECECECAACWEQTRAQVVGVHSGVPRGVQN
jgi:hypothetical protein